VGARGRRTGDRTIRAGKEAIVVEGRELKVVRAALDPARLCELRTNGERSNARPAGAPDND
jgi:hypothetical protein